MVQLHKFKTLIDLLSYFKDEQICREYLAKIRWSGNVQCPHKDCLNDKCFTYSDGIRYKCAKCERQFSVKVNTIFHDSKIPLVKWYASIYLITSHKKGISSLQLAKDVGVTQKTAWYILHRVRFTLGIKGDVEKLKGKIEADETFIGGEEINKHKSAKHLQQYVDESVFRYNTRKMNESNRFDAMLNQMTCRLTYQNLIANGNSGNNNQMETKQGAFSF